MALGYRRVDREQSFLLPPDMRDWLPPDHLVWTVLDVVGSLDTSVFHARSRRGGAGRQGFDPDMLLALLVYAYAMGVVSSRAVERLCATDVAFRVLCAQDAPDHSTLSRFRQAHQEAFTSLFGQVLLVASRAGLGDFGTVAVDGTKIAASASLDANRGRGWLDARAAEIVAEAAATDAAEDAAEAAAGGPRNGPSWLRDPQQRAARLAELAAELDAVEPRREQASREAARRADADARAGVLHAGRQPKHADPVLLARARVARAEAEQAAKVAAWQQRREERGALSGRRPADPDNAADVVRARQRLAETEAVQRAAQEPDRPAGKGPQVNLTDPQSRVMKTRRGWVQGYNAQFAVTGDQLIVACGVVQDSNDMASLQPMMAAATAAADACGAATGRRTRVGTVLADAGYLSQDNLTAPGPDRLIAVGKSRALNRTARHAPAEGPPDPAASPVEQMAHRLATPDGITTYKRRGATVEPGIGNLKKLLPRFSRSGLPAADSELQLAATAFNILKIHRKMTA